MRELQFNLLVKVRMIEIGVQMFKKVFIESDNL